MENLRGADERFVSPFITLGSKADHLKMEKCKCFYHCSYGRLAITKIIANVHFTRLRYEIV